MSKLLARCAAGRVGLAAALAAVFVAGLACAPAGFEYRVPEVVDEATLLARLAPTKDGELVLANFWASW